MSAVLPLSGRRLNVSVGSVAAPTSPALTAKIKFVICRMFVRRRFVCSWDAHPATDFFTTSHPRAASSQTLPLPQNVSLVIASNIKQNSKTRCCWRCYTKRCCTKWNTDTRNASVLCKLRKKDKQHFKRLTFYKMHQIDWFHLPADHLTFLIDQ